MSILKTIPITLDLKRVGAQAQALPTLVEGDNGNVFLITMTDDGEPLDLSTASRIICVFSKTSDGKTVEQDTKDANVSLDDYGLAINEADTPVLNDKIIVINAGGNLTVNVSGSGITGATVDAEKFLAKLPDDGTYEFIYNGESWQYGNHSVTIGGDNHNIVTVALRSASFGAGTNNCEVQVYSGADGEYLVTSANFNFKGRKGIMNDETLVAEDRYPILVSLIADATNAWNNARPFGNPSATLEMLDPDEDAYVNLNKTSTSVEWEFGIPKAEGSPSSELPLALGVADAGTSLLYSRDDHVHPMPSATDVGAATPADVTAITEIKITSFDPSDYVWTSNTHSSDTDGAFPYRCAIPATGVLASMMAEVVFGTASAMSGLYAPICECGSGVVYIWASEQTAPTVLSILAHK
jgi:hypothetical protein